MLCGAPEAFIAGAPISIQNAATPPEAELRFIDPSHIGLLTPLGHVDIYFTAKLIHPLLVSRLSNTHPSKETSHCQSTH